jgi:chromosome segregation ATPase
MSKRIEEIKHTLEHEEEYYYYRYEDDVEYLLQRVEELDSELRKYQVWYNAAAKDCAWAEDEVDKLEAENQHLQSQLERRDQQIAEIRQGAEF